MEDTQNPTCRKNDYQKVTFRLCWCFHQQAIARVVGENTNKGRKKPD